METMTITSTTSFSLLLFLRPPPPPPPPPTPPWRFPFSLLLPHYYSSNSRLRLLPLPRQCLRPVGARKFDFDDVDDDDFGGAEFDGGRRSKSRRRRQSKQRRRWWSDDEREGGEMDGRETSVLDQVVDSLWFLKVLKSYGWFLPVILLSLLLATGPKAFLIAFSVPLGLSVLTLAFNKLWAWLNGTPEPKRSYKTKSPFAKGMASSMEEDDILEDEEESQFGRKSQKNRSSSWAASNNGPIPKGNSSTSGPVPQETSNSKFGGWDELIVEEVRTKRKLRPDQKINEKDHASRLDQKINETDRASRLDQKINDTDHASGVDQNLDGTDSESWSEHKTKELQTLMKEAMSNVSAREREMPLVVKLLVALFPFLGSWIGLFR